METSSVNYEPKFARVLIERKIEKQFGSIIIPDAQRHAKCTGKIIALGETAGWTETYNEQGEPVMKPTLTIGDEVIFGRHSGAWLDATYDVKGQANDDGKLFICQDADILCVIKRSKI